MRFLLVLIALGAVIMACGSSAATPETADDLNSRGTAVAPEVTGRGSAGPEAREQAAPSGKSSIDTAGNATVVFVDADN